MSVAKRTATRECLVTGKRFGTWNFRFWPEPAGAFS
jgi:hypothetical protein